MANGVMALEQGGSPRRDGGSWSPPAHGAMQSLHRVGWVPIALGTAALVAGLGSRKNGALALALTGCAGVTAVAAARGFRLDPGKADSHGQRQRAQPEAERSITIGKSADELRQRWLDPKTLPQVMAAFATVRATGNGRTQWTIDGPLGRTYEWESETVNHRPDGSIGWRSLPNAAIPNEGSVRFRPAPADRGTVVTLHFRFGSPGGALGEAAVKLLETMPLGLAADWALRRFKSLVETGEIPTTERQPAARADTR